MLDAWRVLEAWLATLSTCLVHVYLLSLLFACLLLGFFLAVCARASLKHEASPPSPARDPMARLTMLPTRGKAESEKKKSDQNMHSSRSSSSIEQEGSTDSLPT